MALICIAAAIVFAVRDALKPPDECVDEDGDGECDEVSAAHTPSVGEPRLLVSMRRVTMGGELRLTVLAFPRRPSPDGRTERTL